MRREVLIIVMVVLCSGVTLALTETTFNNSKTVENLTFSVGDENITRYLNIPEGSIITNASIDLNGFNTTIYQEDGNKTSFCSNWDAPTSFLIDGDWSTERSCDINKKCYIYQNYSKPVGVVRINTNWQFRVSGNSIPPYFDTNVSISNTCWNYNSDEIILRVYHGIGSGDNSTLSCYNGTWQTLYQYNYNRVKFYEEAIFWGTGFPENISIFVNNTLVYQNLSVINSKINNIDLNATLLNDYIQNTGFLELSFYSATVGILEYSNLLINYIVPSNTATLSFNASPSWADVLVAGDSSEISVIINNTGDYNASNCQVYFPGETGFSINNDFVQENTSETIIINITPTSSISGNLKLSCEGNINNSIIYTTNYIPTAIAVSVYGASGGGGGELIDAPCEVFLYKPRKGSFIGFLGGFETVKCEEFWFYNNDTNKNPFVFKTNLDNCYFLKESIIAESGSLEKNDLCCEILKDRVEGNLIVKGPSCEQSYNVYVDTNQFAAFVNLLFGVGGVAVAIGLWMLMFIVSGLIIYLFMVFQ